MAIQCMELGPTPAEESCAQVGSLNYEVNALFECSRYRELLKKIFGPTPAHTSLAIKKCLHDFGRYYEVVCYYDDNYEEAMKFAFMLEEEMPLTWEG